MEKFFTPLVPEPLPPPPTWQTSPNAPQEIDFPHSDSNWPNSRKRAAEVLRDVPDDECSLIVEENARRMLNFPRVDVRDPAIVL